MTTSGSPLFIPLTRRWFEAFERGEKTEEFRPDQPRWAQKHCPVGRPVLLSLGYGKQRRLQGVVTSWRRCGPEADPAIRTVYPNGSRFVAIGIRLTGTGKR